MFIHDKTMYTCADCGYETSRKVNFVRHRNRKNPCRKTTDGNESRSIENKSCDLNVNGKILKGYDQNQSVYDKNPNVNGKNNSEHQCNKCKKHFSNRSNLIRHMHICKGVVESPLQCPICLKQFTSRHGKYQHRKNVQCKAVIIENEENNQTNQQPQMINSNNNTVNSNNTNINNIQNNNIQNNNIHINAFGSEDLSYLINDPGIIDRLKQYGKAGIYGLPKILDEVHFKRPENGSIIKPEQFGNTVLIRNEDNEWEMREFEDVREDMIETIIKYIRMYNETKNKLGITLSEKKERNIIKNIGYELMVLDGSIPRDLFHELEMDEDNVEEDENEIKKKTRKFDKSTMHNIHVRTHNGYKREGTDYVKR